MTGLLDGRIALITGAGSGIGEAIAYAMAEAGARVIAADIDESTAERTAAAIGREAEGFACDVTDRVGAMVSPPRYWRGSAPSRSSSTMLGSFGAGP